MGDKEDKVIVTPTITTKDSDKAREDLRKYYSDLYTKK